MSSDIQPGDVVVCVDAGPSPLRYSYPQDAGRLRAGRHYRVTGLRHHNRRPGATLAEVAADNPFGFYIDRFRKLNDESDNAELIAKIRACKPIRTPTHA